MNAQLENGTILVTGAAGFIGSALVWRLNELGYEDILLVDRLGSDERWKNLVSLKYSDFIHADDLFKASQLGSLSAVFHLGACSATTERDADYLLRNNFEYTRRLAVLAEDHRARFVYASSAATYGDGSAGMSDETEDLYSLQPLNMYGYSKHMFDIWAKRRGVLDSMAGIKYFNVFGPNEGHKGDMRSVVAKATTQVQQDGVISLFKSYRDDYADGEQKRDFVYVKDAVDMTIHLAATPSAGGLFNVGSGEAHSWNELAHAIFKALEIEPNIEYVEMPDALRGKYQYYTKADTTRVRESGYDKDPWSLDDSVADYVRNFLVPGKLLGQ